MAVLSSHRVTTARENLNKKMKNKQQDNKEVLLVAQELKIARILAGNNKTSRDRALKSLKKWFEQRSTTMPFTEDDFLRLWKGIFYSMWMSDKPLIQEECAENISNLIHHLTVTSALLYFKCGMQTLINEWIGIDQLRLDKFLMFTRRLLRQCFVVLKNATWANKVVKQFGDVLNSTILNTATKPPLGLFMHFTEIYLEELAKVSEGKIRADLITELVEPFIKVLAVANDGRQNEHIKKFIFTYLIKQSDLGMEYQEKYEAWKRQGFPGNISSMKKVELSDDEVMSDDDDEEQPNEMQGEKPLDPRAGRVDVELPQIKFSPKMIAESLLAHKFITGSNTKSRKILTTLAEQFKKLASGIYPLGVKTLQLPKEEYDTNIRKAVNRLVKFENKITQKQEKGKKRKSTDDEKPVPKKRVKTNDWAEDDYVQDTNDNDSLTESNEDSQDDDLKDKLEDFIHRSEGHLNGQASNKGKKSKTKKKQVVEENIFKVDTPFRKPVQKKQVQPEYAFERNSGTWLVFNENLDANSTLDRSNLTLGAIVEEQLDNLALNLSPNKDSSPKNKEQNASSVKTNKSDAVGSPKNKESSPKTDLKPIKLFSPSSSAKELFPKDPWEEPMQEGEYEICIPSKKYVGKMKKLARKSNQNVQELINNTIETLKSKQGRFSLDSNVIRNPFANSTPRSVKKVKINTKLNKSQEVHEHRAQIKSSPAIPYDANKKPSKPLLKTSSFSTPVNPFYSKQLDVW